MSVYQYTHNCKRPQTIEISHVAMPLPYLNISRRHIPGIQDLELTPDALLAAVDACRLIYIDLHIVLYGMDIEQQNLKSCTTEALLSFWAFVQIHISSFLADLGYDFESDTAQLPSGNST